MSDNKNEAAIALRQALSMMNKHNITKDEVHGQQIIDQLIDTPYYRLPDWYIKLNHFMGEISGCLVVFSNGYSYCDKKGYFRFVGRERDVENSVYLVSFLQRALESNVKAYKDKLKGDGCIGIARLIKSYRYGFIKKVYHRIVESKNQFFTATNQNGLVCIDNKARIQDANDFLEKKLSRKIGESRNSTRYIGSAVEDGTKDANQLQINKAIHKQDDIRTLTYDSH